MKQTLSQYFSTNRPQGLESDGKATIYSSFLEKRNDRHNQSTLSIYKWISFGMSTFAVVVLLFSGNFLGLFDQYSSDINQSVEAQTIGKIIASEGIYRIYDRDSRIVMGDIITLSDTVSIDANSHVDVLVSDDFTAQVFGPAQFKISLNESKDGYRVSFINGRENITVNSTKDSDKNISIQTSDGVLISNNDRNNDLSFSIHHDNNTLQRSIINKSNSSLKINNNNNSKNDLIIEAKHSANISKDEMSDDITILAQQQIVDPVVVTGDLEKVTKTGVIVMTKAPHIVTSGDIASLAIILDKAFMNSEYDDLLTTYFVGDGEKYDIVINNINKRLNRIASIADVNFQNPTTLQGLSTYINTIINGLQRYSVDESTYQNLLILTKKLEELPHHEYGLLKTTAQYKIITADVVKSIIPLDKTINYL